MSPDRGLWSSIILTIPHFGWLSGRRVNALWYVKSLATSTMRLVNTFSGIFPRKSQPMDGIVPTPISRVIRSYMKAIMENAESRKIFYFLMLNLSYMLVQMVYGIWTNSLGLISDGTYAGPLCTQWTLSWRSYSYPHGIRLYGYWSWPSGIRYGYMAS